MPSRHYIGPLGRAYKARTGPYRLYSYWGYEGPNRAFIDLFSGYILDVNFGNYYKYYLLLLSQITTKYCYK